MVKLQLIGNLGQDAVKKNINGNEVVNFSVAHTEKYNDKEKTIWIECAWWKPNEKIIGYLKKGKQVYVEGIPDVRTWISKQGEAGASLSLRVMSLTLLGGGERPAETQQQQQQQSTQPEDDLPF